MPFPPPPAVALISKGKPILGAMAMISSSRRSPSPSVPGTIGTPAAVTVARATALSPMAAMALGLGPMKTRPASSTARVNGAGLTALGDLDDLVPAQIGLARRGRAKQVGLIRIADVQRRTVGL